ncbi:RNA pyrophosphohydrolase [Loktanella sp. 3ANDIMAR09]|uniref:RNA pyrophosphohydrolase n=1 Tax=Loktanella gaetbuli TaxID=2881335 RepID=A0ABS8BU96_9RHOB|nr:MULTISPECIES: RNA pyrophosphohydrolase [Loktanella]KQI69995.1 RNA pyrophosphohydrolase [Loktanella sp. 3ANDIMAR09]MCB5199305.1 RNA pyrophosphohydrolase [Loktanella gaetbuli]
MTDAQISDLPYRPCVGVMLVNTRGHVWVGSRLDRDADAWQMPQGGVDPGETCRDAALRELWEETGVSDRLITIEGETAGLIRYDLPHDLVGKVWGGKYRGQEQKWFLFRFHGEDSDIDIATEHPEFSEWKWMPRDQLVANIVPFKRAVYEQVLAELGAKL